MKVHIPDNEIRLEFSRSGGAGGQNVNKVSSRVQIFWNIDNSRVLTDEQKKRVKSKLQNRINSKGELVITAQSERSQTQNRDAAMKSLNMLINKALIVPKKRKPTKPTLASKHKRIESKIKRGRVKKERKNIFKFFE